MQSKKREKDEQSQEGGHNLEKVSGKKERRG